MSNRGPVPLAHAAKLSDETLKPFLADSDAPPPQTVTCLIMSALMLTSAVHKLH